MISLEHISKSYGSTVVLKDFQLEIREKEAVAVVGESGCGKTTLLRIMAGLEPDYEGDVRKDGISLRKTPPNHRDMALVYQEPALWNHMTVRENILFAADRKGAKRIPDSFQQICDGLEITPLLARYPNEISGGQAKRVSLARALISPKEILLLDEPLSNIDRETRAKVMQFLKEHYVGRRTIVYVSHDMEEVESLCDTRVRLDEA